MKIAGLTDIGSCRQENQDNFCARQLTDGSGWGVVCDGMGGVKGGRVASAIATTSMLQYFDRQLRTLRHGEEKQFILHGFDITNRAVYEKATSDPEMLGMGTVHMCLATWRMWCMQVIRVRICGAGGRSGSLRVIIRWCSSLWTAARSPANRLPCTRRKT